MDVLGWWKNKERYRNRNEEKNIHWINLINSFLTTLFVYNFEILG